MKAASIQMTSGRSVERNLEVAARLLLDASAAAQSGEHPGGRRTYGHSMIVDPWGEILAELDSDPGVIVVDMDMMRLRQVRESFPTLEHRRQL